MAKKVIPQRKRLAAIFASFTILIMGTMSLLESMSLDYYTVMNTLEKVLPASFIIGALGWVMGMILDKPRTKNKSSFNTLFVNDFVNKDLASIAGGTSDEQIDLGGIASEPGEPLI